MVLVLRVSVSRQLAFGSFLALAACRQTPISRKGPAQQAIVSRTYPSAMRELRAAILEKYQTPDAARAEVFRILSISEQPPPGFAPDWLVAYVDPTGYLETYRRLTPAEQANDLVLREATGDRYWLSEYEAKGRPVPFHCGLIIHFIDHGATTEVQVFEVVPTVWVGEHWAMSREGPGFGKYHDIRFVDATVRDRVAVLDFIAGMGDAGRGMGDGGTAHRN
jgi:hypothetical protein